MDLEVRFMDLEVRFMDLAVIFMDLAVRMMNLEVRFMDLEVSMMDLTKRNLHRHFPMLAPFESRLNLFNLSHLENRWKRLCADCNCLSLIISNSLQGSITSKPRQRTEIATKLSLYILPSMQRN
jgi:hypothetical protein